MIPPSTYIDAAGGVVWRRYKNAIPEFLIVHRPQYDDWSLPKGKMDPKESLEMCARREVLEETGYTAEIGDAIGAIAYDMPNGTTKRVRYWLMEQQDGSFAPNNEIDTIAWLLPKRARKQLTYLRDRTVLDRAWHMLTEPSSCQAYLISYSLTGRRNILEGVDRKAQQSTRDRQQALVLAENLSRVPITDILSSTSIRSVQAVTPLAHRLGLLIRTEESLAEGTPSKALTSLLGNMRGQTVVLGTHTDTIKTYLAHLAVNGIETDSPTEWRGGSTWVLETHNGRVATVRYLPLSAI